ncbi:hypothetical protein CC80DRAFT_539922 [Byssothecium circinans]|uniref:F-box domain-containing protein n=1 Tax=Byssothecium circinans TaxID=147558 RepID=A0A6A5TD07_9PLEO|nr:hypothetical protein CC80DRAFT_539922 [Byssothecium circinans]
MATPSASLQAHLRSQTFPIRSPLQLLRPPCPLLKLPAEIRLRIYEYSFAGTASVRSRLALPIVCRQIYNESHKLALASPMSFGSAPHFIDFWRRNEPESRAHIRHIQVRITNPCQIYRAAEELQAKCAEIPGECRGLRLETLTLATYCDLELFCWLLAGTTELETIKTMRLVDRIDEIRIRDPFKKNIYHLVGIFKGLQGAAQEEWGRMPWMAGFYEEVDYTGKDFVGCRFVRKEVLPRVLGLGLTEDVDETDLERLFVERSQSVLDKVEIPKFHQVLRRGVPTLVFHDRDNDRIFELRGIR